MRNGWLRLTAVTVLSASFGAARASLGQTCSATRTQSANYVPGVSFPVSIAVQPDPSTEVYAVEDTPPSGWTVSDISHGGLFDGMTKKVKWGFFFDNEPRVLTYTATPPADETGQQCFGPGIVSCDGVDVGIGGEECIETPIPTVSEWGMVAMTLLVLTAGTLVFMRRRPVQA